MTQHLYCLCFPLSPAASPTVSPSLFFFSLFLALSLPLLLSFSSHFSPPFRRLQYKLTESRILFILQMWKQKGFSMQLKWLWIFWNSWPTSPSPPQGLFPGQSLRSSAEDQLAFASHPGPPCPLAPAHLSIPADGKPADRERLPQGPGQCDVFEHLTHFNGSSGFFLPC